MENPEYLKEINELELRRGSADDLRRKLGAIIKVVKGQGVMQFCRNNGISDTKTSIFNKFDILTFMIWNAGNIGHYQDTKQPRELDKQGYPILHLNEVFFCKNPVLFEVPQQIAFFDFETISYYKNEKLPDGWEWDEEHAFEEYDNAGRRLELLYRTLPQFDEFGVAKYKNALGTFYRIVVHRPNLQQLRQQIDEKYKKSPNNQPVKQSTPKEKELRKKKEYKQKPIQKRKNPTDAVEVKPLKQDDKPTRKDSVPPLMKRSMPDAAGYSMEVAGELSILKAIKGAVHVGNKHVVFLTGPNAFIPFRYAYYGYQIPVTKDIHTKKKVLESLESASKGKRLFPISADAGASLSPFVAWKNDEVKNITFESWEGWFSAITLSIKLKYGIGFSFGGSYFTGVTLDGIEAKDYEKIYREDIFNKVVLSPSSPTDWWGGSVDFGFGVGVPNLTASEYITYYSCRNKTYVPYDQMSFLELAKRWFEFIVNVRAIDDLLYLLSNLLPQEVFKKLR
jgi:hypothetical protein